MNRNTLYALVGVLVVVVVVLVLLPFGRGNASTSDEPCTPQEAYTETTDWVLSAPEDDGWYLVDEKTVTDKEAYDEVVVIVEGVDRWYSWNPKGQDQQVPPAGSNPSTDDRWQVDNGNHNGQPFQDAPVNTPVQIGGGNDGDNGSWFFHAYVEEETKTVSHPAETHQEFKYAYDHPAVECPETPTVTPETPTETPTVIPPTETPTTNVPTPETPAETPSETPAVTPETPEQETPETPVAAPENDSPVESVVTHNSPHKTVKVYTHEDGTTSREVIKYPKDAVEEGL